MNDTSKNIEENRNILPDANVKNLMYDFKKWRDVFWQVGLLLYFITASLEIAIFFVLKAGNLIEQDMPVYLRDYLFTPIAINTATIFIGHFFMRKGKKEEVKDAAPVMAITVMFGTTAFIHRVFLITLVIFCIPIFITVIFRRKKLLVVVTVISEATIVYITAYRCLEKPSAMMGGFVLPSALIAIAIIIGCYVVAGASINILNKQNEKLVTLTLDAINAEKRAEEASRTKSTFLSNMSHEIRTPINAVLGLDEMIIRESKEKEIRDYAIDIRSSGRALLGLINDILDFSKIESGKMDIIPVDYDLGSVINDLVNMIATKAYDKGLSLEIKVNPQIPHILHGDEIRIKQAVLNILSNAVKYTEKGYVKMVIDYKKIDTDSIGISFSVEDSGKGIRKEDIDKLLAPFERIEEMRNRHIEGTGLGMSITTQILALMNSELSVESEYGKGSVFSFEVNQKVKDWEPVGDYEKSYKEARSKEPRYMESFIAPEAKLLVVDDMPINLTVVKGLLKQTQVQVDAALSGMEAIELASCKKYDLIFVDHMMPDMDGVQTLQHIKEEEASLNKDTPIVALTANAVSGAREYYLENGFTDYLTKPIDYIRMEKMMVRLLPENLVQMETQETLENLDADVLGQEDEMIEKIAAAKVLNVEDGIQAAGGVELYKMIVKEFYTTIDFRVDMIWKLFCDKDITNYTIQVHALKSSARLIGANELSELAKNLEMAGKESDLVYVEAHTEELVCAYRELKEVLKSACEEDEQSEKPAIEERRLNEAVEVMKESLEVFDFDTVQSVMEQLEQYCLPEKFAETFKKLKILMSEVARDDMMELLNRR